MKINEIIKAYGEDYKEMTKRLLAHAGLASEIKKDMHIGIKPNLVAPTPADYGATTHPEVVAGIIEYLNEHGFYDITVLEGTWVGDKTSESFDVCGYNDLAAKYSVSLFDTQKDGSFKQDCRGMQLNICKKVRDIDFLINVPVLKGHCQTKITCALKNMKGLIPNSEKRRFHTMGLHKPIAHLNTAVKQDFIVIDHICGDLSFEEGGNPVVRNCVMAAKDPVLTDAYVCSLLNYSIDDVPYVKYAGELGVGCADINSASIHTIEGDDPEPFTRADNVLDVSYAIDEIDSCSACYAMLIPALIQLKEEGLLDRLDTKIAIGQGHQGKSGTIGIGRCTRGFSHSVKGCPPPTEDIYAYLKRFIIESSQK
jgi:uncharacterized protein (DUF362 family)